MTTRSIPGCQRSRVARKASRTSRFARFLETDVPTLREAMIPSRVTDSPSLLASKSSTKSAVVTRRP